MIHGAGVVEDRLIEEKTISQFDQVFSTKVDGFKALLRATESDELLYVTLFSSISGRLGNIGQVDYAMANEVLNKMARQLSAQRPQCKVISINWGPWNGGMVGNGLKRHFEEKGVILIDPESGAKAMVAEMANSDQNPIEIIIGGKGTTFCSTNPVQTENENFQKDNSPIGLLNLAANRRIDLNQFPVLQSHYLDGRPVVPLALIAEWLAHGALHANPGLLLHGIDHLRLFKGIVLEESPKTISLMAGTPQRKGSLFEVDVEIHDADHNEKQYIHSSAIAILTDCLPSAPIFRENGHFKNSPPVKSLDDYYRDVLFHGDALKGLKKIIRISKEGMTAIIDTAPEPKTWIRNPWRTHWIADPLVLDCAFQMAIIWCYDQLGLVSLPNYITSYRQYCDQFPAQGVTAVLEVEETSSHKMIGRYTFLDEAKKIVAVLKGFEAVMDRNLFKAFGVKAA